MSGFVPLNAGYTVSVCRTRLDMVVLLTLALAGSHRPVSFTRVYTPRSTRDRSITRSLQSSFLIKKAFSVDLTAEVDFFIFEVSGIKIRTRIAPT